jgi:hypothetical protein
MGLAACLLLCACGTEPPPAAPSATDSKHKLVMLAPIGGETDSTRSFIGEPLSRDQLRDCVRQQRAIDVESDAMQGVEATINHRRDTLEAEERSIDAQRPRIDTKSQRAVDAFNATVNAHVTAVNLYNADIGKATERLQALNEKIDAFNTGCAGRSYYLDDMNAVLAELGPSPAPPTDNNFRPAPSDLLTIGQ